MTQIEKEAFFHQYHKQKVGYSILTEQLYEVTDENIAMNIDYLQLKSIESITDEDAIELFDLLYPNEIIETKEKISYEKKWISDEGFGGFGFYEKIISFLRSKGYLLPFRQYSTEQLIESGIVKI